MLSDALLTGYGFSTGKQGLDRICGSTTPLHGYSTSSLDRICGVTSPLHGYSASRPYLGSDPSTASHKPAQPAHSIIHIIFQLHSPFIIKYPLQHGLAVPTVIIDGFMDTAPTDGLAVDNNITTVRIAVAEVAVGATGGWGSYEIVRFRHCPHLSRNY
ncbi:hypothetical protein PIB30_093899, partial [Stylosanthes scabra]|nr:hypothetical protein [Stylosanthes scabra]